MSSRHLLTALSGLTLAACATTTAKVPEVPLDDLPLKPAIRTPPPREPVRVITRAKPLPLPGQLKPIPANSSAKRPKPGAPKQRVTAANKRARIEPGRDGFINAIQVFPYTKGALYQVYTAVGQVTDIALQAGEQLVSVSAGDTVRWIVSDTTSGNGTTARTHVLVKPTAEALTTNLVITTDQRSYHVELHSTAKTYMASVSWRYPEAEILALRRQAQAARQSQTVASDIALGRLRFRYRITGNAPWKPTHVFDDGRKVYIRLPTGLAQGEAPPLFVVGDNGRPALVNYRVSGNTYIVDRLFAAAELRAGFAPQRIVRIIRTDARWRKIGR